jgi:Zn-dependent metalloprotease
VQPRSSSLPALGRRAAAAALAGFALAALLAVLTAALAGAVPGTPGLLASVVLEGRTDTPALAFAAMSGATVTWDLASATGGEFSVLRSAAGNPLWAAALLVPVLPGLLLGRVARRHFDRPRPAAWALTGLAVTGYGLLVTAAPAALPSGATGLVTLQADPVRAGLLATVWAALGASAGLTLPRSGRPLRGAVPRRGAAALCTLLTAGLLMPTAASAAPQDRTAASGEGAQHRDPAAERAVGRLKGPEAGKAAAAWNPRTGTPSTVLLDSAFPGDAEAWLRSQQGLVSRTDPTPYLRPDTGRTRAGSAARKAGPGVTELDHWFEQVVDGVPVYRGGLGIHLDPSGKKVWSVTNAFKPGLENAPTEPSVDADAAVAGARDALPEGRLVEDPVLYVREARAEGAAPELVWHVWLIDDARHISQVYFVDAREGRGVVDVEDRTRHALDRRVHDFGHSAEWPAPLARSEGGAASQVADVNYAYQYTGATYSYFKNSHNRDSYDNAGATLVSGVRYREDPDEAVENAFWDGEKMVFGDNMTSIDVTAHELTHAVTEASGGLEYKDQSGALNESYSDVFGEMVERDVRGSNDWLMGADLPMGAIRSMAEPGKFDQPAHMRDYEAQCSDGGGVHHNSGIPNNAFYKAFKGSAGKGETERIWYTALTDFLHPTATFADARNATVAAAWRLYGKGSPESGVVSTAWSEVGVEADTPASDSGENCSCVMDAGLSTVDYAADGPQEADIRSTLYRARDVLPGAEPAVAYYVELYNEDSPRLDPLINEDEALRTELGMLLMRLNPLFMWASGEQEGEPPVVSEADIAAIDHFFDAVARADLAREGGGALAQSVQVRWPAAGYRDTVGLSGDVALDHMNEQVEALPGR